jgi:lysozyme family protein
MATANREASIRKTLTYEGGYTNHPSDPGGPTNHGITIHDARKYWKLDADAADVKCMPLAVAVGIYRQKYWAKMGCDERPAGVDFVDFDLGVNSGVGRTEQFRKCLDPLKLSPVAYVKKHSAKRMSFLQGLRTWAVFGKGWGRRVADVEATGVRMALCAAGKAPEPAMKKEASKATKKAVGHSTAAGGSASAPTQLPDLPDLSSIDLSHKAGLIFAGLILAGVVAYFVWNAVQNAHRSAAYKAAAQEG